jgi:hypothetical protein
MAPSTTPAPPTSTPVPDINNTTDNLPLLDEEQAANNSINRMRKERTTMVNQLNRMINIDTVHENTKDNNNDIGYEITENNNNEIIKSQQLQVTRET